MLLQREPLPVSIEALTNPSVYSRVCGVNCIAVSRSNREEQHAQCTDRAWLTVETLESDGKTKKTTQVFAKCQAANWVVAVIMFCFGVYHNELNAYARIEWPVRTPKVFGSKFSTSRFCLVMEDLRDRGVQFPSIWETTVTPTLARSVLSTLARIHAKFWKRPPSSCWNERTRPYMGKGMGLYTLRNVQRQCSGLLDDNDPITAAFKTALWHWDELRTFYSDSHPKTMVHGDPHLGNFFIDIDNTIGTFDFQAIAEEHPMRDVTYFLLSSYPIDRLGVDEKDLMAYYLSELSACGIPAHEIPTVDECWLQYRLQSFYALYAFVFSGGFADLMDQVQTSVGVSRIVAQMRRVDAAGALYDMLEHNIMPPAKR